MCLNRTARGPSGNFPRWDDVEADLNDLFQVMRVIRRLVQKRVLDKDTRQALWGLFSDHEEAYPDLNYWTTFNFPNPTEYINARRDFRKALAEAGSSASDISDSRKVKNLLGAIEAYVQATQKITDQAGDARFTYDGIKVFNPSRLSDPILRQMLDGLDFLSALFKRRHMAKALKAGIKRVDLTYSPDGSSGVYNAHRKTIMVNAKVLTHGASRLWKNWLQEVFIHEFGHYTHMTYLPADARAAWDSAWAPVEGVREKLRKKLVTTLADRQHFFALIKAGGWNPSKAAHKLKGLAKLKFRSWLEAPDAGEPFITAKSFRWTKRGQAFFDLLRDPEGYLYLENDSEPGEDPDVDEFVRQQAGRRLKAIRGILLLDRDRDDPISGDLIKKIRSEDKTVDEALDKLELPSDYARQDPKEDFAESFVAFMVNPGALSKQSMFRMQRALSLAGLYGKPVMEASTSYDFRVAALFNVGDPILYGKYKNKKGIIIKFLKDEKGYPAVEIEQLPNPTGRKEKKVLTLFKIRKSPKPFKKPKKATISERVAARYLDDGVTHEPLPAGGAVDRSGPVVGPVGLE